MTRTFSKPIKTTLLSETWKFTPIKATLLGKKLGTLHQSDPWLQRCSNYREFTETTGTFKVVFGLLADRSIVLVSAFTLVSAQFCN